uniref:Uncharacterized protein n=1 Tax=viral metagenome TaxID=1070528 RepID=A0A6M3IWG5_9ZZZZ
MPRSSDILKLTTVRAATELTASYVEGTVIECGNVNQVSLFVAYTMGAGETSNSIEIKTEFKPFGGDSYYREASSDTVRGTVTLAPIEYSFAAVSAAGTYDNFVIEVPANCERLKVSAKETGKATNFGTCSILANASTA